jgi:hypothetical protein
MLLGGRVVFASEHGQNSENSYHKEHRGSEGTLDVLGQPYRPCQLS